MAGLLQEHVLSQGDSKRRKTGETESQGHENESEAHDSAPKVIWTLEVAMPSGKTCEVGGISPSDSIEVLQSQCQQWIGEDAAGAKLCFLLGDQILSQGSLCELGLSDHSKLICVLEETRESAVRKARRARHDFYCSLGDIEPDLSANNTKLCPEPKEVVKHYPMCSFLPPGMSPMISEVVMGYDGPDWPVWPQYHIIRSCHGMAIASDGLSDPWDTDTFEHESDEVQNAGLGYEIILGTPDLPGDLSNPSETWLFQALQTMCLTFAGNDGFLELLDECGGILSFEVPGDLFPKNLQCQTPSSDKRVGVLVGVPAPGLPAHIDLPGGKVRLIHCVILQPEELQRIMISRQRSMPQEADAMRAKVCQLLVEFSAAANVPGLFSWPLQRAAVVKLDADDGQGKLPHEDNDMGGIVVEASGGA